MNAMEDKAHSRRRRIDLRQLPFGLGYMIAGAVSLLVILAAWHASRGSETPGWWESYAVPILYWSSPILVLLAILARLRRRRRAQGRDSAKR
jgi:hypothetical protein